MEKNKIPTKHLYINNCTIYVCDVVKFDNEIFVVKYDGFFYPVNPNFNNGERVRSTSIPIEKIGTIEEYPEYFI